MNDLIKCENCIFWITAQAIQNHVGVCARDPQQKDLNTLVSTNISIRHHYTEKMHWCGEFMTREKPHKTFIQCL